MPVKQKAAEAQHAAMATELLQYHFKKKPVNIRPLGGGITNFVYGAKVGKEEFVIRISEEREKINFFLKEQWAVARAREKGLPVPEILEVGNDIIPLPYMIVRKIEGEEATHHPMRWDILRELGQYAAIIHTIPTEHFGHMFNWSHNLLSKNETWKDYLECELRVEERLLILKKHKMLSDRGISRIGAEIKRIRAFKGAPSLHHGDLRLKNTMVNAEGKIVAIIDWENCISSIPPYWDISIALHDLSIDAQWRFLEGYGLTDKQIQETAAAVKVFNILNYAPVIERLAAEKQKNILSHYRVRLTGALDMYSL